MAEIDPILLSLLVRHRELRDRGLTPTPEEVCKDAPERLDDFRQAVRASDEAEGFLDTAQTPASAKQTGPFVPFGTVPVPNWADVGGRLTNVQPYAKGGMGEVLLATDPDLRAVVVVKVIHAHLANKPEAVSRFLWEAGITARLNHPGVPPVHGIGTTADGRPCYTMRFIAGRELGDAIAEFRQTGRPVSGDADFRDLLGRFVTVCQIVAYAHGRGVIHRDLKPRNIRLGEFGETVVLDWGLAKVDGEGPPDVDERGLIAGTRGYMSPEQEDGRQDEVDEQSDVFALGRILTEITGDDCPKPLAAVARMATNPIPLRRHKGTLHLASDVSRWLADEPVSAYRDSIPVRLARRARKNPLLATAALVAVIMLSIGLIVVTSEQAKTAKQRDETAKERDEKELARKEAVANAFRANEHRAINFELQNEATRNSLDLLSRQSRLLPEHEAYMRKMYELNLKVARQPDQDEDSRMEAVAARARIARILAQLGRLDESVKAFREAIEAAAALAHDFPNNRRHALALGEHLDDLGNRLIEKRQFAEAGRQLHEAQSVFDRLVAADPGDRVAKRMLSFTHNALGDLARNENRLGDARREFERAIELRTQVVEADRKNSANQLDLAKSLGNLGLIERDEGRLQDAANRLQRVTQILNDLLQSNPTNFELRLPLAITGMNLGAIYSQDKKYAEAVAVLEPAALIFRQAWKEFPSVPEHGHNLVKTLINIWVCGRGKGDRDLQVRALDEAVPAALQIVQAYPDQPTYLETLADVFMDAGTTFASVGQWENAEAALRDALKAFAKLLRVPAGATPTVRQRAALTHSHFGDVLANTQRYDAAMAEYQSAHDVYTTLSDEFPGTAVLRFARARTLTRMGHVEGQRGRFDPALSHLTTAANLLAEVRSQPAAPLETRQVLRECLVERGFVLTKAGRHAEAVSAFDEALAVAKPPERPYVIVRRGVARVRSGNVAGGLADAEQMLNDPNRPEGFQYMAARVYARVSERPTNSWIDLAFRVATTSRAMGLLIECKETGFFATVGGLGFLKSDEDLQPMRNQPTFQRLIKECEEALFAKYRAWFW